MKPDKEVPEFESETMEMFSESYQRELIHEKAQRIMDEVLREKGFDKVESIPLNREMKEMAYIESEEKFRERCEGYIYDYMAEQLTPKDDRFKRFDEEE